MSSEASFSLFLAGDSLLVRPWSSDKDPAFLKLVETIRAADLAIANLETVIHEFKGYAQADSGGIHMHSPPSIAVEMKWAGFDLLVHANNHAFDYGSTAVLETIAHVRNAGLELAGSGKDLQEARAPRYFRSDRCNVALVAMASTLIPYGTASRSRTDLHGRPGVNPLAVSPVERGLVVPRRWADRLRPIATRFGVRVREGERFRSFHGRQVSERDRQGNLDAISEAAREADFVVVSIHAHRQGHWLAKFAAQAIDLGADVIFVHGPHQVGAVELRNGKPIFYSLGDFVYETQYIEKYPSDAYDKLGLGDEATPGDLRAASSHTRMLETQKRVVFEGCGATLYVSAGMVNRIRLDPVDLRFDAKGEERGRPRIAAPDMGRRIIGMVAEASKQYGTTVRYDAAANCGEIECA